MKKLTVLLCLAVLAMSGCGKDEKNEVTADAEFESFQSQKVSAGEQSLPQTRSAFINALNGDSEKFVKAFKKYDAVHQYYFCSAFAMGAMSAVKPITASAMVNYFMGLGVVKYKTGIDDSTYEAFNAGKNVFLHESLVNTILEKKICEDIMNKAVEYARDHKVDMASLDKLGKREVKKVVEYISKEEN